jgi:hypothetical protein
MSKTEGGGSDACEWCGVTLDGQAWVSLVRPPKAELRCCSEDHLVLALTVNRALTTEP